MCRYVLQHEEWEERMRENEEKMNRCVEERNQMALTYDAVVQGKQDAEEAHKLVRFSFLRCSWQRKENIWLIRDYWYLQTPVSMYVTSFFMFANIRLCVCDIIFVTSFS